MPLTRKLQVLPLRVLVCEAKIAPVPLNKAVWKDPASLGVVSLAFALNHCQAWIPPTNRISRVRLCPEAPGPDLGANSWVASSL